MSPSSFPVQVVRGAARTEQETKMATYNIHFNQACFGGRELAYIADAIGNRHIAGDGPFAKKCQELLKKELGVPQVLLTTSCTHALEMAALLLDMRPGDEVIV